MQEIFYAKHTRLEAPAEELLSMLSPSRQERAERAHTDSGLLQSVSASLLLEEQLRAAGAVEPLAYGASDRGKPYLQSQPAERSLEFSISHCDDWAACAIGTSPVGVDVERVGRGRDIVVRKKLHPAEALTLDNISFGEPSQEFQEAFAIVWTAKEAIAKCLDLPLLELLGELNLSCLLDGRSFKSPVEIALPSGALVYLRSKRIGNHILACATTTPDEFTFHHIDK